MELQMARMRRTNSELDALLKFMLGITLGAILFFTSMGILYALIFVEQPLTGQSENDKMFFNVLGSVATFITGTLAGLLIGKSGADAIAKSIEDMPTPPASVSEVPTTPTAPVAPVAPEAPLDPNYN